MVYSPRFDATRDVAWLIVIWLATRRRHGGKRSASRNGTHDEQAPTQAEDTYSPSGTITWPENYRGDIAELERLRNWSLAADAQSTDFERFADEIQEVLDPILSGGSSLEDLQRVADAWWHKFGRREIEVARRSVAIQRRLMGLYMNLEHASLGEWQEYARAVSDARWGALAESEFFQWMQQRNMGSEVEATHAARREARQRGVDLRQVEGTGSDGRITFVDVVEFAERQAEESE